MTWLEAALLGIVEGLTEFLPVSSTGHLILIGEWLGHNDQAAKTLDIVIQLGAVLAVIVAFRARIGEILRGVARRDPASLKLAGALAISFVPAAALGYLFHRPIKDRLFGAVPVAGALIAGGVAMIAVDVRRRQRGAVGLEGLEQVTPRRALVIGLFQSLSLWPGASRSMTTILGGQLVGLNTKTAAEFSFLLAIPTLGAATVFDLVQNGHALLATPSFISALIVGLAVSFVVAILVITAFLRYLRRFGLAPFGAYRIALGAIVLAVAPQAAAPKNSADPAPESAALIAPGRAVDATPRARPLAHKGRDPG